MWHGFWHIIYIIAKAPAANECDPCASKSGGDGGAPQSGVTKGTGGSICPSDKPAKDEECPFVKMNLEEFADCFPDEAPNFIERPTFWPHTKDEQLTEADKVEQTHEHKHPMDL